jgi:hypothetical protein
MGRVVAAEYLSVDGRMEMEDPEGEEQELGGWTAPYWNDELQKMQYDQLFASDALLLGRSRMRRSPHHGLLSRTTTASPTG